MEKEYLTTKEALTVLKENGKRWFKRHWKKLVAAATVLGIVCVAAEEAKKDEGNIPITFTPTDGGPVETIYAKKGKDDNETLSNILDAIENDAKKRKLSWFDIDTSAMLKENKGDTLLEEGTRIRNAFNDKPRTFEEHDNPDGSHTLIVYKDDGTKEVEVTEWPGRSSDEALDTVMDTLSDIERK